MKRTTGRIVWCAFGLYIVLMLWLLFGQRIGFSIPGPYGQRLIENLNLVPFRTIGQYLQVLGQGSLMSSRHAVINLVGNVVMFVPLGFFLPLTVQSCRKYGVHLLWVLGILLCIELLQLFTLLGSCDVDDFILNVPGTAIGYGFYRLIEALKTAGAP